MDVKAAPKKAYVFVNLIRGFRRTGRRSVFLLQGLPLWSHLFGHVVRTSVVFFFVRALHLLIFVRHALFLYVEDLLLLQDVDVLDITASLCITFCMCFGIQLSWRELQLGASVVWIGWELHFHANAFSVPQEGPLGYPCHAMLQQRSKVDR